MILRRDLFFRKFRRLALLKLDRCNLPKMTPFAELFYAKAIVAFFWPDSYVKFAARICIFAEHA